MQKKNYIYLLSVLSAYAVVTLHTNCIFWVFSYEPYWFWANITECIFYFAVPVFFMISGITLIDYKERYSTKTYFLKRLNKIFVPFLFWSLFGVLYYMLTANSFNFDFAYIINGILNNKFVYIYWFFIPLFLLYLTIPVLAEIKPEKRIKIYTYILILLITINSLIPFVINVFNIKINYKLSFLLGAEPVLYALIGYILSKIDIPKKYIFLLVVLGFWGLFIHITGTDILSNNLGKVVRTYKGYYNIPCILYSTAIFILVKQISDTIFKNKYLSKIILFLKDYTFPIYLLHYFVLDMMNMNLKLAITRLGSPFIIIPICILITYILRKIPIVKRIVP